MTVDNPEFKRVSDEEFMAEIAKAQATVGVPDLYKESAEQYAVRYGLEEREKGLLAVEIGFFADSDQGVSRKSYWDLYEDAAERIIFGTNGGELTQRGWFLRWGATFDGLNRAWGGGNTGSFEGMLGSKMLGLRGVIFNLANEEVLDEHDLCLRKLGRRAVAA